MKFVTALSDVELQTLSDAYSYAPQSGFRRRAHAILLSNKGYTINQISDILNAHRETVSIWLTLWDRQGLLGLKDDARSGRPPTYDEAARTRLKQLVKDQPCQLKAVQAQLAQETGKTACVMTLKRALKK